MESRGGGRDVDMMENVEEEQGQGRESRLMDFLFGAGDASRANHISTSGDDGGKKDGCFKS